MTNEEFNKATQGKIYKTVKLTAKDPEARRYVDPGDTFVGQVEMYGTSLVAGSGNNGLTTSTVQKITALDDGNFSIETRNSTYLVEHVK